jgi:hypothetical protein
MPLGIYLRLNGLCFFEPILGLFFIASGFDKDGFGTFSIRREFCDALMKFTLFFFQCREGLLYLVAVALESQHFIEQRCHWTTSVIFLEERDIIGATFECFLDIRESRFRLAK